MPVDDRFPRCRYWKVDDLCRSSVVWLDNISSWPAPPSLSVSLLSSSPPTHTAAAVTDSSFADAPAQTLPVDVPPILSLRYKSPSALMNSQLILRQVHEAPQALCVGYQSLHPLSLIPALRCFLRGLSRCGRDGWTWKRLNVSGEERRQSQEESQS